MAFIAGFADRSSNYVMLSEAPLDRAAVGRLVLRRRAVGPANLSILRPFGPQNDTKHSKYDF